MESRGPQRTLGVLDATCLIVGVIIGAGLYEMAPMVATSVSSGRQLLLIWMLGGLVSLFGALAYSELATTYPEDGGDVGYLRRAYGDWAGFVFGWMQLLIVRPGDIALMAFVFARYANALVGIEAGHWLSRPQVGASLAVVLFTGINWLGLREAAGTQNLLTIGKVIGFSFIILIGLLGPPPSATASALAGTTLSTPAAPLESISVGVALVMILFCYGGWNEMAYITAEVRDPRRNILRSMLLGLGTVIALYLLANASFLRSLGFEGLQRSTAVAVEVVAQRMPRFASQAISLLVAISALSAMNGLMLAGSRIAFTLGRLYPWFHWLGNWNAERQTPVPALLSQSAITLVLINVLGGFADTLIYTAPTVYTFYGFTSAAVIVLRRVDPTAHRAFPLWGYPWTVLIFVAACLFMTYSAVLYRPYVAAASLGMLLLGLPVHWITRSFRPRVR
jgi:amino acid transporter